MRHVIFNHWINEFRTKLFIPQRVLHCLLLSKRENSVTLTHCAKGKNAFLEKPRKCPRQLPAKKKIAIELLHQRLGHRSTRSLLAWDTANVWEDIDLIIDTYPFFT